MYQHIDLLAAQSMAREREHDLQASLRQRRDANGGTQAAERHQHGGHHDKHHWFHDLLERAHLVHAPLH